MRLAAITVAVLGAAAADAAGSELGDVRSWLYFLDVNLDEGTISRIADSGHDMVVIDFITSETENTGFRLAATVMRWREASHPKLVVAYIDIGQAESYRTYWRPEWRIGDPVWITGEDPDGWAENYPVAYWHDAWRAIWLDDGGYVDRIVAAGFDGIYLDWVEAFDDPGVMALAAADGVDARREMVWWIEDLAARARSQDPDFLVIAQNAAELVADADYRAVIDALAQEQVWFDGGADNRPPGDCPLPRLDRDVETAAYLASLSAECRRVHDAFPDSTLHISSEAYLEDLEQARAFGLPVFTVDYALDPANRAWIAAESRGRGFVPFVGARALDRYEPPLD